MTASSGICTARLRMSEKKVAATSVEPNAQASPPNRGNGGYLYFSNFWAAMCTGSHAPENGGA